MAEPTDTSDTSGTPDPAEKIAGNPDAGARTPAAPGGVTAKDAAATDESQGGKPVTTPNDPQAGAAPGQGASAPPPPSPAASANTPEQEAKIAAMRAKIEALKAAKAAGGGVAASPTAASTAAAGSTAVAEPATATATAAARPVAAAKPAPPKKTGPPKPRIGSSAAPKGKEPEVGVWYFGRRDFLQSIGWMSFAGFFTIMLLGTLRAMFPRVIYEKPPVFKAGFPGDYVPGTVSEKYKDEERVWIIRQFDGSFIALLAICTHLGCTPRWLSAENKFKCPCHGSGFRGTPNWGVHFEGPAPRPLERVAIALAPDGQIQVDKSRKFLWEKNQWDEPGATLKV